MSDMLSLAEIQERFAGQWVLIGDPQTNELLQLQRGRVLFHSQSRDEACRKVIALHPPRFVLLRVAAKPEGKEFALLDWAPSAEALDIESERSPRTGYAGWLVGFALAGLVYLETTNAPLSVAAVCVKAGWSELSSGWWLFRSDPLRRRARACLWFYTAASFWKIWACGVVAMFVCMALPEGRGTIPKAMAAAITMFIAMGLTMVVGWIAMAAALTGKIKVWVNSRVRTACGGSFVRMIHTPLLPAGSNRAFLVIAVSLAVPAILVLAGGILLMERLNPNTLGFAQYLVGAFLFACPLMMILITVIVSSKIAARSPRDCWPPAVIAFGRMISTSNGGPDSA